MPLSQADNSDLPSRLQTPLRCFQYHPSIVSSDAIGNSIRALDRMLRQRGIESWMVCSDEHLGQCSAGVRPLSSVVGMGWRPSDVLIVHYSFYDKNFTHISSLPVRKVLVYHNVTPSHFFRRPGMEWIADVTEMSLAQIAGAREVFELAVGDSKFNLSEMPDIGVTKKIAIPIFYDEISFHDCLADKDLYFNIKRSKSTNLLFVGRFVPNKRHDKLIDVLAETKRLSGRKITLHVAGKVWNNEYYLEFLSKAASRDVLGNVRIYQDAPLAVVRTLFAAADAFVSMSEHEGFMVPLLEAFAAGCPVVAHPTTAIGETMGDAGLKVENGLPTIAAGLIEMLSRDRQTRLDVVAGQASRALDFRGSSTFQKWLALFRLFEAIEEVAA